MQEPKKIDIPEHIQEIAVSESRKVVMTILEKDLDVPELKGLKVLEIGCGDWDYAKTLLQANGCKWHGIDVVKSSIATSKGTVENIPFLKDTFDIVLCNQSMEHWYEYGVSFEKAFSEINRVLKIGGKFMANAPIHYHGHPWFLFNKMHKVRLKMFPYFSSIRIEQYYNKEEKRWRKLSNAGILRDKGFPNFLFPKNAFSRQAFIYGTKVEDVYMNNKESRFRIVKVFFRFVKEWLFK